MEILSETFWLENSQLVFNLHQSSQWYPILYQIAFFAGLLVFLSFGIRQKYPLSSWLIISAFASFLLVVGSKLGTYSLSDWKLFFDSGILIATGKKTALGAALLIALFLGLVIKAIRFQAPYMGAFAFFLPVIMLVQRVGCMMAGCCYGKPLETSGGVKYFGPSLIRDRQVYNELLPASESITLPVHNVPLYFILVALGTVVMLLIARRWTKDGRQLLLLSLSSMVIGRFFIEFFRDTAAHNIPQRLFYGLTQQQWSFIVILILLVLLFRLTLQTNEKQNASLIMPKVFPLRNLMVLFVLALLILGLQDWFTVYERYVLYFQMTTAGILNLKFIWLVERQIKPLVAPFTLFFATTLVMAQESPTIDEPQQRKTFITTSYTNNRLHGVGYPCIQTETGCSGDQICTLADTAKIHGPYYSSFQLGALHNVYLGKNNSSFSLGMDFGSESFLNKERNWRERYNHYSLYSKLDFQNFGLSLGFRFGTFFNPTEPTNQGVSDFLPRIGLRFGGDESLIRAQLGVYDEYLPAGITPGVLNLDANFRLLNSSKLLVRPGVSYGIASMGYNSGVFYGLNAEVHLKQLDLVIRPTYGISVNESIHTGQKLPQFALQLRKGFGHKKR